MNLSDLNARFKWTQDSRFWDSWRRLRGSGPLKGDCDDYAVTALHIACGGWTGFWWALVTFRACFWFTRLREGELHMMVWRKGMGWIDNAHPLWGPRQLPRLFPMPWPGVILKLMMGLVR
tara:strand:- start:6119 stop:6478 length:360 start_codon:yes stop_codon:yes gene_type:complete